MKLIYKILWIEDQMNSIRGRKRVISNYIKDEKGFELEINEILTFEQFKETVGFESLKDYDLLLVDLNLDDNESGDGNKIIEEIRNNDIYTEIIFYSSHYEHLINLLKENRTEGIFTSERNQIDTKAKKIIDVTLHKIQDVNNLRGLIMAEVAELDILKEEIIKLASQKINQKELEKYTLEKIKSSGNSNKNKAQKHLDEIENITFDLLFEKIGFIDSNKKAMTIGEALEKLGIKEPVTKETFTQSYIDNILTKRNLFAHVKECDGEDANGNYCKVIGNIPFTEEKCIEIRKEIKKYKKLLETIKDSI
jgi:hypothetical protein